MTNIDRIKVLREIRDKNLGVAGEDLGFKDASHSNGQI